VSSKGQEEDGTSLGTQEQQCREYALRQGYVVDESHVYREVHTGTELWTRPQLIKLREAIRARAIDVVVVYAIDRLSRDPVHLGVILSEADHAGVLVEFVSEPLDDSPEGQLIRFVRGYAAKIEHEKIKERTLRGKRARLEAGKLLHGKRPAFGYQWNADHTAYEPDPSTAPVLRRIFALLAGGETLRGTANRLNAEGIVPPSGQLPWRATLIHYIATNPRYIGQAIGWRTVEIRDKQTGKRNNLPRPEAEQILLPEGTIPALVTPELFEAVQARLRLNQRAATRNNRNPEASLLRGGYVLCGYCDHVMSVHTTRPKGQEITIYRCNRNAAGGTTDCHHGIAIHLLDGAVWERVSSVLRNPALVAAELERLQEADPDAADLEAVERRLTAVVREQRNYVENLGKVTGPAAALIAEKINALEVQREQLTGDRDTVLARSEARQRAREQLGSIEAWCRNVAANLGTLTYEEKRLALDALGVQAKVWHKSHTPRYTITANIPLDVPIVS
ncbi:MAG TPA: recombinase family protein, partial [Chloroflexota bacterium]|nr:recombinase family protein [Chloroflexota bacterium]